MHFETASAQQTQNICITFMQCWTDVEDVGGRHCINVIQMFCACWEGMSGTGLDKYCLYNCIIVVQSVYRDSGITPQKQQECYYPGRFLFLHPKQRTGVANSRN